MRKVRYWGVAWGVIILVGVMSIANVLTDSPSTSRDQVVARDELRKITNHTDAQLAPFLWDWMDPVSFTDDGFRKIVAKKDPLRVFFLAFRLLALHERAAEPLALDRAVVALNYMLNEYQPAERLNGHGARWFYGFDYEGIKAPWWSGMDSFFGPMTLYAGYQATGDIRYREAAIASAKLALRSPTDGGVLWKTEKGCWISEYTWRGMSENDEFFVLNGHLWGLQALYMLADASGDQELKDAYACARKGTFARESEFYNKSKTWTWYQLNPKVINPTHYNIIEMAQFRAMHLLTGDPEYKVSEDARGEVFRRGYPISLYKDRDGALAVFFSMIGPPHPYWTDTYPVSVRCIVNGKEISARGERHYTRDPLDQRLFIQTQVTSTPTNCRISIHSNVEVPVYTETSFPVVSNAEPTRTSLSPTVELDARSSVDGRIVISPAFKIFPDRNDAANDEARITLPVPSNYSNGDILALVLRSEKKVQLGMFLEDEGGNRSSRYYPDLPESRDSLIMLHELGFDGNDGLTSRPKSLTLRIYTSGLDHDFNLEVLDYRVIDNGLEMKHFLSRNANAHFPQQ